MEFINESFNLREIKSDISNDEENFVDLQELNKNYNIINLKFQSFERNVFGIQNFLFKTYLSLIETLYR